MQKKSILIVEDSPMVMKIIKHVVSRSELVEPVYATCLAEVKALVDQTEKVFFAAMVDLSLPDAPNGEVVDYVLEQKIPAIVLTGSFDEKKRGLMLEKGIVDYVTKEGRYSYELALQIVHRLVKNERIKVLVVDDSKTQRKLITQRLRLHRYQVLEAGDGVEAIKVVLDHPDVKLLITDYNMPRMDGAELIKNLRAKYEKSDLVIIGLSSADEGTLSAKLIKCGANDFLRKPFNHEEFFCRVTHNIEFIELIEQIRDSANRDELTGAFTRQYFFRQGTQAWENAEQKKTHIAVAVIDLDQFVEINQNYGHEAGDKLMRQFSSRLKKAFDRFVLARSDGQEFMVLMPGLDNDKAVEYVGRVRQITSGEYYSVGDGELGMTFTAGVSNVVGMCFDEQVNSALKALRRAKNAGGDIVLGD